MYAMRAPSSCFVAVASHKCECAGPYAFYGMRRIDGRNMNQTKKKKLSTNFVFWTSQLDGGIEMGDETVSSDSDSDVGDVDAVFAMDWTSHWSSPGAPPPSTYRPARMAPRLRRLSRKLAYVLRHYARSLGLDVCTDGFVEISELLAVLPASSRPHAANIKPIFDGFTEEEVLEVAHTNAKQRFDIGETGC